MLFSKKEVKDGLYPHCSNHLSNFKIFQVSKEISMLQIAFECSCSNNSSMTFFSCIY